MNRRMSRTNSSARNFDLNPALGGGPNVRFGVICGRTAKPCGPGTHCWCQAGGDVAIPTGLRKIFNPPATEARGIRLRGERGISRKPTAQGMPGRSGCTCMLVCASLALFAHATAGASRHPAFPAPSSSGRMILRTSGASRRENADVHLVVVTRLVRNCALGRVTQYPRGSSD